MLRRKFKIDDYNKQDPFDDSCIKFFIVYEGSDREPNYFEAFKNVFLEEKKAYIHHVLEDSSSIKGNMPKNLINRAKEFIKNPPKNLKFTPSEEDKFRFVIDVDKHPKEQIIDLKEYSDTLLDSNIFISNFCFEIWLWFHLDEQENISAKKSKEIKTQLGDKQNELKFAAFPHNYMVMNLILKAIERAENTDKDKNNYFPVEKSTKVYLLIKELLEYSILNIDVEENN
ncbi:RloB family protein [Flavobacterium sp.]|uniref:RloB family protein n=1 Tax=Flavobacterium sp. TaxID=239 RepID=UPI0037516713